MKAAPEEVNASTHLSVEDLDNVVFELYYPEILTDVTHSRVDAEWSRCAVDDD